MIMQTAAKIVSFAALAAVVILPVAFFADRLALERVQTGLLAATLLWFASAPLWMETRR